MIKKITGINNGLFGMMYANIARINMCTKYTPNDRFDNPIIKQLELFRSKHKFFTSRNMEIE